jgi:transmembrane sensor
MSGETLRSGDIRVQRLEQAALWLQRLNEPAQEDPRVVEAWLDWCQRDPLNQQAFDELATVWELSAGLGAETVDTFTGSVDAERPNPRRRALAASLAVLALAAAGGGAWWLAQPAAEQLLTSELSSPTGRNSASTLQDGSLLELGGGTRVTVTLGPSSRRVELHEGELFVAVRQEPNRPFSVHAGRLEVTATGTAFNVLRTDARTTVTVAEGSVDARFTGQDAAAPMQQLESGKQLVYFHASHSYRVDTLRDPAEAIAWRKGKLSFPSQPLSEAIATINRYAAERIVIEDPSVGAMTINTTAHIDNIGGWLEGVPVIFPNLAVEELADGRHRITARRGASSD